jgi:hypothetical protein
VNAGAVKTAILDNPYIPLCVPPVCVVLQFMLALVMLGNGLPNYMTKSGMSSIPVTGAFFALSAFTFPAILLGIRNLIYNPNKVAPALGIALNLVYLVSFLIFFLMFIVLKVPN